MLVSRNNEARGMAEAVYFWLLDSHVLLELLGTAYMRMIIPYLMSTFDLPSFRLCSQEPEDTEEPGNALRECPYDAPYDARWGTTPGERARRARAL